MRPSVIALLFGLAGCSLARAPLSGEADSNGGLPDVLMLDAAGLDSPGLDAPDRDVPNPPDTGEQDAPVVPDVPAPPDTPPPGPDTPRCAEGSTRCAGEVLETCRAGAYAMDDCAGRDAYCEAGACVPRACTPAAITCSGATEERCDARGASAATMGCTRGCTGGVGCNPETACGLTLAGTMGIGMMRVDTCGEGNETRPLDGCTRTNDTGSDVVIRLEVPVRANYRIEAQASNPIDPVLYIRTACASRMSELACDDDSAADWGSQIDITLDPGDYFLMVDSFRDGGSADGRCGAMNVVVTTP